MRKTKRKYKGVLWTATVMTMCAAVPVSAYGLELIPVGQAVGITVDVDGVLVENVSEVTTDSGTVMPAKDAGIKAGDVIVSVGGTKVDDMEDFAAFAKKLDGTPVSIKVLRDGKTLEFTVTPVLSITGRYQLGLWLQEIVAGVGTVTYYNPKTGEYGALGHGVSDPDTGKLIPITDGQTYDASIVDVVLGKSGTPGELTGSFDAGQPFGTIRENTVYGIFGLCGQGTVSTATTMETAARGEVREGHAEILSTVNGRQPRLYDIRIDKVQTKGNEERYQFTVTDPELLAQTGGVVCGMSGSPIIQDGKLIGAVTHVCVNL